MFDKFNEGAQRVLILGQEAAAREKHSHLGTEHIMFGLLQSPGEANASAFKKLKVDLKKLVEQVEKLVEKNQSSEAMSDIPFSPIAKSAIEKAVEISKSFGEDSIDQDHLLLGMLSIETSDAVKSFKDSGFEDIKKLEEAIRGEIESGKKRKKILSLLNETASKALVQAREEALESWNEYIGTEHILLGILKDPDCVASVVLKKLGVDMRLLQKTIKELAPPGKEKPAHSLNLHFDSEVKQVIEIAASEAKELGHTYIGTEHILLGTLGVKTCAGASALNRTGVSNIRKTRIAVEKELESRK